MQVLGQRAPAPILSHSVCDQSKAISALVFLEGIGERKLRPVMSLKRSRYPPWKHHCCWIKLMLTHEVTETPMFSNSSFPSHSTPEATSLKKKWSIYLAALSLSCGMWDLQSLLWHAGFFSCGMWTLPGSMWDLVPWSGINPCPLCWECRVSASGPPGKSPESASQMRNPVDENSTSPPYTLQDPKLS